MVRQLGQIIHERPSTMLPPTQIHLQSFLQGHCIQLLCSLFTVASSIPILFYSIPGQGHWLKEWDMKSSLHAIYRAMLYL